MSHEISTHNSIEQLESLANISSDVAIEMSQSSKLNSRKRRLALLEMTMDRNSRQKLPTGGSNKVAAMIGVADSCQMIITHSKPKKAGTTPAAVNDKAPKTFSGIITNSDPNKTETEFIHVMSQLEQAWAVGCEVKQRDSIKIPNGSFLNNISTFDLQSTVPLADAEGRRAIIELQCVSFSVAPTQNKSLDFEVENPFSKLKEKQTFRQIGDPYITFSAAAIRFLRWATYEELASAAKNSYVGPVQEIPAILYTPVLPYPDLPRKDIDYVPHASQKNAKGKSFVSTINPWEVSTDILLSRMYPEFRVIIQTTNDLAIYEPTELQEKIDRNAPLSVITTVPGDDDKELLLPRPNTNPVINDAVWRNESGKHVVASSFDLDRPLGKFDLFFGARHCVSEFGIVNPTHWKKVAAQLIRALRCLVLLGVDPEDVIESDELSDYTLRGFAEIAYINAPVTFRHAGLKVSYAFAEKTIKEVLGITSAKGLKSDFATKNDNIMKFINEATRDQVQCFCMNEYSGNDLDDLANPEFYDIYAVPFSIRCTIANSGAALNRQRYWEKNDLNDLKLNEKIIEDERWADQCLFFVVKKPKQLTQVV